MLAYANGYEIKSPDYTYIIDETLNDGASAVFKATRNDGKPIFLKLVKEPTRYQTDEWNDYIDFQHKVFDYLKKVPKEYIEENYEYFEFEDYHFQAKKFEPEAMNLKDYLDKKKIDINQRFYIAKKLAEILNAVHDAGIIHTDLKPEQFLVIGEGKEPKIILADFDHCIIPSLNLYRPTGTKEWLSPEHVKNEKIGFASDVFTLGQIIYTVLTGKQPFMNSILNDTYDKDILTKKDYVPLNDFYGGQLPPKFADVIDRTMEPDASKRPSTKEVLKAFDALEKPKTIKLILNGKTRYITGSEIITRQIVKSNFQTDGYKEVYNKQFEIIKDKNGDWFIKGYPVPKTARDAKGHVYNFYPTEYNGEDVTNKIVKLVDNSIIKVGSNEFEVRFG